MTGRRWTLWLPLALFAGLALLWVVGLRNGPETVIDSKLVGQPLPPFALEPAMPGLEGLSDSDLRGGKPQLVNVFASWCVPCVAEAPQLAELARRGAIIQGIAIRDKPEDVGRFLQRNGNPYRRIGSDPISAVQLALGSSGVPETFVVDGKGIIRYQHIGDIRADQVDLIMGKLAEAGR